MDIGLDPLVDLRRAMRVRRSPHERRVLDGTEQPVSDELAIQVWVLFDLRESDTDAEANVVGVFSRPERAMAEIGKPEDWESETWANDDSLRYKNVHGGYWTVVPFVLNEGQTEDPIAEVYAYMGKDELGSGEIGLKQGLTPAGMIPLVSMHRAKLEHPNLLDQMRHQVDLSSQAIMLVRFLAVEVVRVIRPSR